MNSIVFLGVLLFVAQVAQVCGEPGDCTVEFRSKSPHRKKDVVVNHDECEHRVGDNLNYVYKYKDYTLPFVLKKTDTPGMFTAKYSLATVTYSLVVKEKLKKEKSTQTETETPNQSPVTEVAITTTTTISVNRDPKVAYLGNVIAFAIVVNNLDPDLTRHRFYVKKRFFGSGEKVAVYVLVVLTSDNRIATYVIDGFATGSLDAPNTAAGMNRALKTAWDMISPVIPPCIAFVGDDASNNNIGATINRARAVQIPRVYCMQHLIIRVLLGIFNNEVLTLPANGAQAVQLDLTAMLSNNPKLRDLNVAVNSQTCEKAYKLFHELAEGNVFSRMPPSGVSEFLGQLARIDRKLFEKVVPNAGWVQLRNYFDSFTSFDPYVRGNLGKIVETIDFYVATSIRFPANKFKPIIFTTFMPYAIRGLLKYESGRQPSVLQFMTGIIRLSKDGHEGFSGTGFGRGMFCLVPLPIDCGDCFTPLYAVLPFGPFETVANNHQIHIPRFPTLPLLSRRLTEAQITASRVKAYRLVFAMNRFNFVCDPVYRNYPNFQDNEIMRLGETMKALAPIVVHMPIPPPVG